MKRTQNFYFLLFPLITTFSCRGILLDGRGILWNDNGKKVEVIIPQCTPPLKQYTSEIEAK